MHRGAPALGHVGERSGVSRAHRSDRSDGDVAPPAADDLDVGGPRVRVDHGEVVVSPSVAAGTGGPTANHGDEHDRHDGDAGGASPRGSTKGGGRDRLKTGLMADSLRWGSGRRALRTAGPPGRERARS